MAFQFFDSAIASPSGAMAGIFIPRTDLPGVMAGEFASATSIDTKNSKAVAGILNKTFDTLSSDTFNKLGFSVSKGSPIGVNQERFTTNYGLTAQYLIDLDAKSVGAIPVPTVGTNTGIGKFSVKDIFADAEAIAADGTIPAEGVLIPFVDTEMYGGEASYPNIAMGQDNRSWLAALYTMMVDVIPLRSATQASALTTKARPVATGITLGTAATAATNPTTGINASGLGKINVMSQAFSLTVEYETNQALQTFDVRVATS